MQAGDERGQKREEGQKKEKEGGKGGSGFKSTFSLSFPVSLSPLLLLSQWKALSAGVHRPLFPCSFSWASASSSPQFSGTFTTPPRRSNRTTPRRPIQSEGASDGR